MSAGTCEGESFAIHLSTLQICPARDIDAAIGEEVCNRRHGALTMNLDLSSACENVAGAIRFTRQVECQSIDGKN